MALPTGILMSHRITMESELHEMHGKDSGMISSNKSLEVSEDF